MNELARSLIFAAFDFSVWSSRRCKMTASSSSGREGGSALAAGIPSEAPWSSTRAAAATTMTAASRASGGTREESRRRSWSVGRNSSSAPQRKLTGQDTATLALGQPVPVPRDGQGQ